MIPLEKLQDKVRKTTRIFPWYKELIGGDGDIASGINRIQELPLMTADIFETYYYHRPHDPSWPYTGRREPARAVEKPSSTLRKTIRTTFRSKRSCSANLPQEAAASSFGGYGYRPCGEYGPGHI